MSEPKYCEKHPSVRMTAPDCPKCGGDGYVESDDWQDNYETITCWQCGGNGFAPWVTCDWCDQEYLDREDEMMEKRIS